MHEENERHNFEFITTIKDPDKKVPRQSSSNVLADN